MYVIYVNSVDKNKIKKINLKKYVYKRNVIKNVDLNKKITEKLNKTKYLQKEI